MEPTLITAKQMQLGDTVQLASGAVPFCACTVKQIRDGFVTLFRPYVHTADFSYTGGVMCYVGVEEYTLPIEYSQEYYLLERKTLK